MGVPSEPYQDISCPGYIFDKMDKLKRRMQDFLGQETDHDPNSPTLRILPLGDSITFGLESPDGNGYRKRLRSLLERERKVNVEYKGTEHSGDMPNNCHAGWNAKTIQEVGEVMGPSLEQGADVILLHAGTNDW